MKKCLSIGFSILLAGVLLANKSDRPNIVVIMADDLGFGDLACYGAKDLPTPNVDSLANNGVRFTAGYTSASTCTPTRFSFLTGKYAFRQKGTGIAPPNAPSIIKEGTTTFPKILRSAGYETAIIGKWHLGLGKDKPDWNGELKPGPKEIGFDYSLILPTTNDRVPSVYVENGRVKNLDPNDPIDVPEKPRPNTPNGIDNRDTLKLDWSHNHNQSIHNGISRIGWFYGGESARFRDEDLADTFTNTATKWIKDNKDNNFFLLFTSCDVHVPRMPHERFQGKTKYGFRGDATLEFDWSVGEIINTLKQNNLLENTLVIICSDNGPVLDDGYKDEAVEKLGNHKPSGDYRGGKYSPYEGGARTPFIVYWKGKVSSSISNLPISTIDLGRTLVNIAGIQIGDDVLEDSLDMTDTLLGKENAKPRPFILIEGMDCFSYQTKDWKIVDFLSEKARKMPTYQKDKGFRYELFKIGEDQLEKTNLYDKEKEIAEEMLEKLNNLRQVKK